MSPLIRQAGRAVGWAIVVMSLGSVVQPLCAATAQDANQERREDGRVAVSIYDPTGRSPEQIMWKPYPASPPEGFHWQESGSPSTKLDPLTGQPLPGQITSRWILVRDGYSMPKIR